MNLTATQRLGRMTNDIFKNLRERSGAVYTLVTILALAAFEIFNFSVTNFALRDILGDYGTGMLSWSMILSLAFCGMDISGIASILSANDAEADKSGWYLLGAWVLAAAMNAGLTWWGISTAIYNQPAHDVLLIDPMTYVTLVPVLVAVMVWVIRVLIIGSLVSSLGALNGNKRAAKRKPFGFPTENQTTPPGFTPVPARARMDESGFPR